MNLQQTFFAADRLATMALTSWAAELARRFPNEILDALDDGRSDGEPGSALRGLKDSLDLATKIRADALAASIA